MFLIIIRSSIQPKGSKFINQDEDFAINFQYTKPIKMPNSINIIQIRIILFVVTLRYIFLRMFLLLVIWRSVSMSRCLVLSRDSRWVSRSSMIPIPTCSVSTDTFNAQTTMIIYLKLRCVMCISKDLFIRNNLIS